MNIFKMPVHMETKDKSTDVINDQGERNDEEFCEALIPDRGVLIERIISTGQSSPEGFWYDQERDEWVVLLQGQARLVWKNGRILEMKAGDWIFIPAHECHRVEYTSEEPPCIWLAVHGKLR